MCKGRLRTLPVLVAVAAACSCAALRSASPRYARGRRASTSRPATVVPTQTPPDPRQGKLAWPTPGRVVGAFGVKVDPKYGTKTKNLGIDLAGSAGTPVKATEAGKVSYADQFMGYGRTVIVDHGDRLHSIYSRLSEIRVSVGEQVVRGQVLAFSADTLHFQIRKEGQSVDPEQWLQGR